MFPGAMTFDTLSYARRLKQAGLPEAQAEAIADATRELVVQDVATKADIAALKADMAALKADMAGLEQGPYALVEGQGPRVYNPLRGGVAVRGGGGPAGPKAVATTP